MWFSLILSPIGESCSSAVSLFQLFYPSIPANSLMKLLCTELKRVFPLLIFNSRYYYTKKEFTKAAQILQKIANYNHKNVEMDELQEGGSLVLLEESPLKKEAAKTATKSAKSWNYLEILLHPNLRLRVLMFSLIKLYLCMAYFGSIFALSNLGGNIHTNSIIAACAEALGYALSCKSRIFFEKILTIIIS